MPKPQIFTEDEKTFFRAAIDHLRSPEAYEPGKWMVSLLNRDQSVIGGSFPKHVTLRDITLRTTEQMPGVVATEERRREFLEMIVGAGVADVQTSAFPRGHTMEDMREEIAVVKKANPSCEVNYGEVRSVADINTAAEAGYDAVQFWAAPWAEAAPIYAGGVYGNTWAGRDWHTLKLPKSRAEQIARAETLIAEGKREGVRVSAGVNMLPYASDDYVHEYCHAVAEAGAYEIVLFDGPSGVGPEAYAHLVTLAKEAAPNTPIGVHAHNMFDLGTACSLAAARVGAEIIEVSVNGYCAASGQADLAVVSAALTILYDVSTGIHHEKLTELARYGEEFTGRKVAWNHPITGLEVFNWGGMDTVVQELEIDPLLHWCMEPSLFGNVRKWDITRDSGPYTMWDKLDLLGVEVAKDEVEPILAASLRAIQENGRVLTDDEIREIAAEVISSMRSR